MDKNKVCVIGLGYIGLPTAAILANNQFTVTGVDIQKNVVDTINRGEIHIVEPDLEHQVKKAIQNKKLVASTTPSFADIFIIAVPTPFKENHVPDISYVIDATKQLAPFLQKGNIVILESTSPVGTTNEVNKTLIEEGVNTSDIYISHCPERVLPGNIMEELINNDRIVGGINRKSTEKTVEFYKKFVKGEILLTDDKTAEMAKLTENSFRDVNIAFANELSILCEKLNINVNELIQLANKHPRVNILNPGVGVGGHCIAVDPWFIIHKDKENSKLIKTAREINIFKTEWVIDKIQQTVYRFEKENNTKPTIACLGLAFKPNIDDLRESPALNVVNNLIDLGYNIIAVEPNIIEHKYLEIKSLDFAQENADIIVVLVAHEEFQSIIHSEKVLDFS